MKKYFYYIFLMFSMFFVYSTSYAWLDDVEATKEAKKVAQQQEQYAKGQPVPFFNWSLERHLVIELYKLRNQKVATHSVWRGATSVIEGDCPSMGYGLPYDLSLTNPLKATEEDSDRGHIKTALATIEQAEPNGLYASKATSATWVMCVGEGGILEPTYIETKVTVYSGPVEVDYITNRVKRVGKAKATVTIGN